jgi:hypothetical protein
VPHTGTALLSIVTAFSPLLKLPCSIHQLQFQLMINLDISGLTSTPRVITERAKPPNVWSEMPPSRSTVPFLNIVCYKWGNRYNSEEVNILRASVERNLSVPHKFHCITDDPSGLDERITVVPLPEEGKIGNGPKIRTFSAGFLGLGPDDYVVSLDIDIVIVGSLDFLAEQPEFNFIIAPHRASNSTGRGHGAVYRVRVGSHREIWDSFIADAEAWAQKLPGRNDNPFSEQRWLARYFAEREMHFFPEGKIIIFRVDCNARSPSYVLGRKLGLMGLTTAFMGTASLPGQGEAIVSFSGLSKPQDVRDSHHGHLKRAPFVAEHWHL